jgi:hypothetical protein
MHFRIVSCKHLKQCRLWPGSIEESSFLHGGGISLDQVLKHHASLSRCDDRTEAEDEYLAALAMTLDDEGWL